MEHLFKMVTSENHAALLQTYKNLTIQLWTLQTGGELDSKRFKNITQVVDTLEQEILMRMQTGRHFPELN